MTAAHFGEGDLWLAPPRGSAAPGVVYQPHPKYSLREGDSLQLNHHIAYKTLRDITITAALQPIHNCRNPQKNYN